MKRRLIGFVLGLAAVLPVTACVVWAMATGGGSVLQGEVEIQPGDFLQVPITVLGNYDEVAYDFTVRSGPAVDVYVLSDDDYARYQAGLTVQDRRHVYEDRESVSESPYLPSGSHHAVIDNTDYGVAVPAGSAVVVDYSVRLPGPPEVVSQRFAILAAAVAVSGILFVGGLVLIVTASREPVPR